MADRFSGFYEHSLDPKGRVIIPAKFRGQLGSSIAIMRGTDKCIKLYSLNEWNSLYQKYESYDEDENPEGYRKMRRLLATSVEDNVPDKQGRLLIPPQLREYAGLDRDIVISGMGRHVEIWERSRFFEFIGDEQDGEK